MDFADGGTFLKNPSVWRKIRKLDFGDGDMVLLKIPKLDFGDGDAVLLKIRKLDFGDGGADSEKPAVCSKS